MKKLLLGTIVLLLFAVSLLLVQISCSKTGAQVNATKTVGNNQLNKIIFTKDNDNGGCEIWLCDYDGSNQQQIPVTLPEHFYIDNNSNANAVRLSPDGQTVFFVGNYTNITPGTQSSIYACTIDGKNMRLVVQGGSKKMHLGGAY